MSEITFNNNNPYGPINRAIVTADGQIKTLEGTFESTVNSSTTLLASGATYTGTAELNDAPDVMVVIKSDTNGTVYYEFSVDGSNWDTSLSFVYSTTRINPPHIFVKGGRYFRVRFVNEGGNQTVFRLNTYYGTFSKLTAPINGTLAESYDAIVTRPTNFHYEVAMGKRQGYSTWNKWGYNADIDSGVYETIWSPGGVHERMTTASTLNVVSTSVNDTEGGTGVQSVILYGVDENYDEVIEVVTMSGTTSVETTSLFLGINRMAIYLVGSLGVNDGDLNVSNSTPQAQIPAGEGTTQQAIFFVPRNHTALVDWLFINVNKISGGGSPRITVKMWVVSDVSGAKYEVFRDTIDTSVENHVELKPSQPFVVGESSYIYVEAVSTTNDTIVSARFSLILERNI